ncbi:MAG: amino acid permease [Elusimicrobiales bacterium]|nr:amino acid permease [Elusimicrobiales bacterium]
MSSLFRTKSVDLILSEGEGKKLAKVLGSFDVVMIGIGAIIGAGIFAMVGEAALKGNAGPSLVISFIITAIACGFCALCYAELASMVPISGSAYTYTYATMGEIAAWIIGWDLILEYAIGNIAVAISWSGYFNELLKSIFGFEIPIWLRIDYRTFIQRGYDISLVPHIFGIPIIINLLAVLIIAFLTWLLVIGIKESSRFNDFMVLFKILILVIFIGAGFYYFNPDNLKPFAPGGLKGIQIGAATIFFAYIGFDAVSTVAEETKNPSRDMPIGIIGSLLICTIIYILVTISLMGMIPYQELKNQVNEPLVAALNYHNAPRFLTALISIGAVISTTAVLLVFQMGQPRIFFAMARDGLLPKFFSQIHPKYKTPHITTIATGIFVGFFSAVSNLDEMASLCNIGTLFAFILVCLGVIILRIKQPQRPRPFKLPFGFTIPILGIISCIYLMLGLDKITWFRFIVWLLIGLIIYFFYGYKKSKLNTELIR